MNGVTVPAGNFVKNNRNSASWKADDGGVSGLPATPIGSNNYDVFLSFSGTDTRKTFVDHLYNGLVDAGICVFKDEVDLSVGEDIGIKLLQAIKNSKISIPVLSQNYASSKWCLQELVQMTQCMKGPGHIVLPIFYRVKPAEVRCQKGSFGEAFSHLSWKYSEEDVAKWKQALQDVASLKGWESEITANGCEGKLVRMIIRTILSELKKAFQLVVPEQLVGIDNAVENVLRLLDGKPNATQIVGIHGMGGIGKTTLAKVIYNKLFDQFQDRSFIADIRESSQCKGILCLQNQLMHDILGMKDHVSNLDEGIRIMGSRFKCKKVLILLDDVDDKDQLKALVGKCDWFEMGSRIIITTRIRSVLDDPWVNYQYELKEIEVDQSLILFSRHAFRRDSPPCDFESLSHEVVSTTGGLPLALEVIGSFLCGKKQAFWQDALKKLKKVPHREVQKKLRISYDALNNQEKHIFLDIACFFIGTDLRIASCMWDAYELYPGMGIEILRFMSLIKIGDNYELKMHDQLRDLGREIVRQESYDAPINRSRLWVYEDALEVLQRNKGIQKVRIQALRLERNSSHCQLTTEQFETLPNLRFLQVRDAELIGCSKSLLPDLRWLAWNVCPAFRVTSFCLEKLLILDLSRSDISERWEGWSHLKVAKQLKVLNLTDCHCLKVTPVLSAFQKLEILVLKRCHNLEKIDPSIGEVRGLVSLDLWACQKLRELPGEIGKLEELKELKIGMTAIRGIPPSIGSLKKLEMLDAYGCHSLVGLPDSIENLVNLLTLDLRGCSKLYGLPESIGFLVKLQRLLCNNMSLPRGAYTCLPTFDGFLRHIPDSIGNLKWLTELNLSRTDIKELPASIGYLKNLKILNIAECEKLSSLPTTIGELDKLEELDASSCKSLGGKFPVDGLVSLKMLLLCHTGVSGFAYTIYELSLLEKLDLQGCQMLQSMPQFISKLCFLQHLHFTYCHNLKLLPELPACLKVLEVTCQHHTLPQLSHLIHLKELTVVDCRFLECMPELPSGILKLYFSGCHKLKQLPGLSSLESLLELDLHCCCELTEIKDLKALKSLAKLTVSGCKKLSNLDGLEHVESLRYLDLSIVYWSDAALVNDDLVQVQGLDRLKNLEGLNIGSCQSLIRPDLSQLTHLKRLNAGGCQNLVEIKGLERLKNLEELDIRGCTSIETLPDLSCFNNLKHLKILECSKLRDVQGLEKNAYLEILEGSTKNLEPIGGESPSEYEDHMGQDFNIPSSAQAGWKQYFNTHFTCKAEYLDFFHTEAGPKGD